MKKLLYCIVALLTAGMYAQNPPPNQAQPIIITQSFSAAGTGAIITTGPGVINHTLSWTQNSSTAITGCTLEVDGSPDSVTWNLGSIIPSTTCNSGSPPYTKTVTGVSANYVRINIVGLATGNIGVTYTGTVGGTISSGGSGGTGIWGQITGTLADQSDLQNALNAKVGAASPALTGIPTSPTATLGTNTTQIATTAFVNSQITSSAPSLAPVQSVAGKTGAVTLAETDITNLSTDLAAKAATTYVNAQDAATLTSAQTYADTHGPVVSVAGKTGAVTLAESDIANLTSDLAAKAALTSPVFTGSPTAPTQLSSDNSTKLATTAFVVAVSGGLAPVQSVAGKTGVVTLAESDIANLTSDLAAKAPLVSPALTGTPTAPTATLGTNTTQVSTTAFVQAAINNVFPPAFSAITAKPTSLAGYGITDAVPSSRSITASGSLSGGGTLTGDLTLQLVNDAGSPGTSFYYGTNSSGTKGFFALPSSTGITLQTNGVNNSSQTSLNFITSTADSSGLVVTPSNSGGSQKLEVSGTLAHSALPTLLSGDIPNNAANTSGTAALATALAASPTGCTGSNFSQGIDASGNSICATPPGGGDVSTTPAASQNIVQPPNTTFSADKIANIPYVVSSSSQYNWSASPSGTISIGSNTVSLSVCPKGLSTNDQYVYVSGSGGNEADLLTAVSCTAGSSGTITFTAALAQNAGYTVGTATGGIKEASEDAKTTPTNPSGTAARGEVIIAPGYEPNIYAPLNLEASQQTIDFSGSILQCWVAWPSVCVHAGKYSSSTAVQQLDIRNLTIRAMVAAAGGFGTNANGTDLDGFRFRNSATGAYFEKMYVNYNDQAAVLNRMDPSTGTAVGQCNSTDCSDAIYSDGTGSGITWVKNSNLTLNCLANGVNWSNGNTLRIIDSTIQGYPEFGVSVYSTYSTTPNVQLNNVYEEIGSCTNPKGTGQEGVMVRGGWAEINGGVGPSGTLSKVTCTGSSGSNEINFYAIVHDSVLGVSPPLLVAESPTNCSGTASFNYPRVTGTNTITYDFITTYGNAQSISGPYGTLAGGTNATSGSVATSVSQCASDPCTLSVDTSVATSAYTLAAVPNYHPALTYWPGPITLSPATDNNSSPTLYKDQFGIGSPGVLSVYGYQSPSVFVSVCSGFGGTMAWVNCLQSQPNGNNNPANVGTVFGMGVAAGGTSGGFKGRLNLNIGTSSQIAGTELITLLDSNSAKTFADPHMRPSWDANDTFIGLDNTGTVTPSNSHLAFGSPQSISNYIATLPNGTGWLERLTSSLKEFKTAVQMDGNLSVTSGTTTLSTLAGTINLSSGSLSASGAGTITATAVPFSGITSKPTSVAGYGITDAVPTSRTVTGTNSISGGGALSGNLTLQLLNDSSAPGNSYYYGTNSSGTKGFFVLPTGGPALQTNGVSNSSQTMLNFITSTVNAAGLTVMPVNSTSTEAFEITGTANTAAALASVPSQCTAGQFATGIAVSGNANCSTPAGAGNVSNVGTPTSALPAIWTDATHVAASPLYLDASQFSGADPSVKINACLAAVVTATGGICDARAFAGNQTLSQEIDVGHNTAPIYGVKLILPEWGTWTWSGIVDGTSCGIRVYSGGSIEGNPNGGTGNKMLIRAASGSSMDAMLCTDPAPATGGAYVQISGFKIDNGNAATFANGVAHIQFLYDQSEIRNVYASNATGDVWHIENVCCGTDFWNIQGISAATGSGGYPLVFGKSGATLTSTDVTFYNSTFNAPGTGKNDILITGGTTTQSPTFISTYMEGNGAADTTTPMVEVNTAEGTRFIGGQAKTEGGTAKAIFHVTAPYSGLSVQGFSVWNSTTCIVDAVTGVSVSVVNYTGSQGECGSYSSLGLTQTNGTNIAGNGLSLTNSTTNSVGLALTFSNPTGNHVKAEITGGSYTGNASTATALASLPSQCSGGQFATGITVLGAANCSTPPGLSAGSQYGIQYSSNGSGGFAATTPPTANGIYQLIYNVTGAAAVAPTALQTGIGGRSVVGSATTDTVLYSDSSTIITHNVSASGAVTETLPTATTLGNPHFAFKYCNHSAQTDTITPTTWTIQAGTSAAASSLSVPTGVCYFVHVDDVSSTNWLADGSKYP